MELKFELDSRTLCHQNRSILEFRTLHRNDCRRSNWIGRGTAQLERSLIFPSQQAQLATLPIMSALPHQLIFCSLNCIFIPHCYRGRFWLLLLGCLSSALKTLETRGKGTVKKNYILSQLISTEFSATIIRGVSVPQLISNFASHSNSIMELESRMRDHSVSGSSVLASSCSHHRSLVMMIQSHYFRYITLYVIASHPSARPMNVYDERERCRVCTHHRWRVLSGCTIAMI